MRLFILALLLGGLFLYSALFEEEVSAKAVTDDHEAPLQTVSY